MDKAVFSYLQENNLIGPENLPLLIAYSNAWQSLRWADLAILDLPKAEPEGFGITCSSVSGSLKLNPAIRARIIHLSGFLRFGSLLGLDPVSRSRVTPVKNPTAEDNPFMRFCVGCQSGPPALQAQTPLTLGCLSCFFCVCLSLSTNLRVLSRNNCRISAGVLSRLFCRSVISASLHFRVFGRPATLRPM